MSSCSHSIRVLFGVQGPKNRLREKIRMAILNGEGAVFAGPPLQITLDAVGWAMNAMCVLSPTS